MAAVPAALPDPLVAAPEDVSTRADAMMQRNVIAVFDEIKGPTDFMQWQRLQGLQDATT
jgi:hypothetical protein